MDKTDELVLRAEELEREISGEEEIEKSDKNNSCLIRR